MSDKFSEEDLKSLAKQLSNPTGEDGIKVGQLMNEGNIEMIKAAIEALQLKFGQSVLELGPGNAGHLKIILDQAEYLNYFGVDISNTMKAEAERINAKFIELRTAFFTLYDGTNLPFKDKTFDATLTVNTIYFWEKPAELLNEVYRVLKPGGRFAIAYGQKDFMKNLPFVKHGFQLYNDEDIKALVATSGFEIEEIQHKEDDAISKTGEKVRRQFGVAVLMK
ncbi:class I SAM-dependent methyltransferase [Owenweeksia hongkongensis]|uniref:class I SAM-dependent methyltransferase n=1 Tax=Owenweeksia hongkongensis TaxID=253245 RepID=UPI003A927E80